MVCKWAPNRVGSKSYTEFPTEVGKRSKSSLKYIWYRSRMEKSMGKREHNLNIISFLFLFRKGQMLREMDISVNCAVHVLSKFNSQML